MAVGFIGKLLQWWNNSLTEKSKDKTTLEIVTQNLEELVKKEPITPSPSKTPQLSALDIYTTSSNSSRTSTENEKEIE